MSVTNDSIPTGNPQTQNSQNSNNPGDGGKRPPQVRIDHADLRKLLRIPPPAALLWQQHVMHQGKNASSWCSLDMICDEMAWNKDTVCKWRKWLVEHGWLLPVGEREKKSGAFAVRMFRAVIGEVPVPKPSEAAKRTTRIRNLRKWSGPKPSEVAASQTLGQEVVSEKQVASKEQIVISSPDGGANKKSYRPENETGAGSVSVPSEEKNQTHPELSVSETEHVTLPAPVLVLSPPTDECPEIPDTRSVSHSPAKAYAAMKHDVIAQAYGVYWKELGAQNAPRAISGKDWKLASDRFDECANMVAAEAEGEERAIKARDLFHETVRSCFFNEAILIKTWPNLMSINIFSTEVAMLFHERKQAEERAEWEREMEQRGPNRFLADIQDDPGSDPEFAQQAD